MLAEIVLSQLLQRCAPSIGTRTMSAIVRVESDSRPLTIHDNTDRKSYLPRDTREAVAWAKQLLAKKHSIDLGLSQINDANLKRLAMSVDDAFDPCSNLRGGSAILLAEYRAASSSFGPGQFALRRALGAYNTGSLYAGYAYVDRILEAAGLGATQDFVPDLERTQAAPVAANVPRFVGSVTASAPQQSKPKKPKRNPFSSPILLSTRNTMPVMMAPAASPVPAVSPLAAASPVPGASPQATPSPKP